MKTTIATSIDVLADYNDKWESLRRSAGANVYNNNLLSRVWLDTFKDAASPQVILVEDKGELVGIAPLALSNLNFTGLSLKTLSLIGGVPNSLRLVTNSIMCPPDRRDVLKEMIKQVKGLKWSFLWTQNMDDCPTARQYVEEMGMAMRAKAQTPAINQVLELKETGDIAGSFARVGQKNLRTSEKLATREGRTQNFRIVPTMEMGQAIDIYAQQHIERWESRGGSSFKNPLNCEFLKRAASIEYGSGRAIFYEYLLDDDVIGQLLAFTDGDKAYIYRVGMSNDYMRYSPGWMVYYYGMTDLRDRGVRYCIMGGGQQRYKYDMGAKETLLIGAQASRGIASLIDRVASSNTMKKIDSRLKLTDRALSFLSVENTKTAEYGD